MKRLIKILGLLLILPTCKDKSQHQGKQILRYNELGSVTSLDPASAKTFENIAIANQLYNGLVQMDDSLNILPCIAKRWEVSEDGKVYTFFLRSDVYFHDNACFKTSKGRKVVADDFSFSFMRLMDAKVSSAISLLENVDKNDQNAFTGFKAENDTIFKIYLKKSFTPFINILSMKYFSVIPEEAIEKYGEDFRRNPVGTGPFQFNFWEEGNKLVLIKNENYFEFEGSKRLPYLDGVSVSFIRDKETAFLQFIKGDFDLLSGLDAFNSTEVLDGGGKLKSFYADKINLQGMPYIKTDYLGFIIDDTFALEKASPIINKKIRQAISYSIDREKIVRIQRKGLALAAKGFVPQSLIKYKKPVEYYSYNPDMVNRLLAEAGIDKDHPMKPITVHTTEQNLEICEMIQGLLQENGIPMKILVDKASVIAQSVANGEFNFFRRSWIGDYGDAENFLQLFYSKNFSPYGSNYFHFKNSTYDYYYEQAIVEQNDSTRQALYREMEQIILDEAPVVPLFYDYVVRLVQKNVKGLNANGLNLLNLKQVQKQAI